MHRNPSPILTTLLCAGILILTVPAPGNADDGQGKPASLLTTQDEAGTLAGWESFFEVPNISCGEVWRLEDGVLICKGTPKGYLSTRQSFTNFVLTLEWRWPAGKTPGNGGVLVRMTGPNTIWPKSLEAQINTGQAGDFWGLDGYSLQGPAERSKALEHPDFGTLTHVKKILDAEKPAGEWNRYEIIADNEKVTLKINGKLVNQATGCEVVAGKICLTAEGDEIHFRNLEVTAN
jgi:hypothetical protein